MRAVCDRCGKPFVIPADFNKGQIPKYAFCVECSDMLDEWIDDFVRLKKEEADDLLAD